MTSSKLTTRGAMRALSCRRPFGAAVALIAAHLLVYGADGRSGAPQWWNIIKLQRLINSNESFAMSWCSSVPGLGPKQLRFCKRNSALMRSIATGTKLGVEQCKFQFENRRWNCKTLPLRGKRSGRNKNRRKNNLFGPVLEIASRESAFVHAITAAGVTHAVTRDCARNSIGTARCGCAPNRRVSDEILTELDGAKEWRWRGCNDDVEFGAKVSREFVDARDQGRHARAVMNRHNNEAGRMAVIENMEWKCKCHGVSGSCELKSCWRVLATFDKIGLKLKRKYVEAVNMKIKRHREVRGVVEELVEKHPGFPRRATARDLIYYQPSANFCDRNLDRGIPGTQGRVCNATSAGVDGCALLCCGRGHVTATKRKFEHCDCRFVWCCSVTCNRCVVEYEEHRCK